MQFKKVKRRSLKVDMPILTCIFFTCNWLTLTSEMHFVKFHPEVASCLLSRGKRKYAPLGMRLLWKYIRNYFLVYHLTSHFLLYLQNCKELEAEILDLQLEKYGLSFDIKKYTTSGWALGDENVIGIRSFNCKKRDFVQTCRFYAKNRVFLQIERNVVQTSTRMHKFWSILKFVSNFCHLMLCFKRRFSKKSIKIKSKFVLYGRFTPLTRPFYKFSTELK